MIRRFLDRQCDIVNADPIIDVLQYFVWPNPQRQNIRKRTRLHYNDYFLTNPHRGSINEGFGYLSTLPNQQRSARMIYLKWIHQTNYIMKVLIRCLAGPVPDGQMSLYACPGRL